MSGPRTLVLVPARGGSKGIPGKNLQRLGEASLLEWAVKIGLSVPDTMGVFVSTDYSDIAAEARKCGARVLMRPDAISQDDSTVVDMINHHLRELDARQQRPELILYLEPTSPFRTLDEINACLRLMETGGHDAVATFKSLPVAPGQLLRRDDSGRLHPYAPGGGEAAEPTRAFALTGGVYVFSVSSFLEQQPGGIYFGDTGHIVQTSPGIDIDTPFELETARGLLQFYTDPFFQRLGLVRPATTQEPTS